MARGFTSAAACIALLAAVSLAGPDRAAAQVIGTCGFAPGGNIVHFDFDDKKPVQTFRVPADVTLVTITAEGGHGGEFDHTDAGGAGGLVEATFPVTAGECLNVFVGGYGYHGGGEGFAEGGSHGVITGDDSGGNDGAGGGGASAVTRGFDPLLIAGGGGGAGGDGQRGYGGDGGDGGFEPRNGETQGGSGKGGKGGGQSSGKGGDGGGEKGDLNPDGGGGGGGGGFRGGGGGSHGFNQDEDDRPQGGAGGGGGSSNILFKPVGRFHYGVSTRNCVYKHFTTQCHGLVTISWSYDTGPLVPLHPQIHVLPPPPSDLIPVSLPIVLTPARPAIPQSAPSAPASVLVRLELSHRHKGKWRRIDTLTATATPEGPTELDVALPKRVRKLLRGKRHGRVRIEAFNAASGERIDSDQLRFD
jgi:hypothetical protein